MTRILSIDPALRNTGYAVLAQEGSRLAAVTYGVVRNAPSFTQAQCLLAIERALEQVINTHAPHCLAIESVIYVQSYQTAIALGSARGVALLVAARCGLPIHEYAPRRVKQAVVGRGGAQKQQVCFMVRALLGLTETPPSDAADALAVGIAHAQTHKCG